MALAIARYLKKKIDEHTGWQKRFLKLGINQVHANFYS